MFYLCKQSGFRAALMSFCRKQFARLSKKAIFLIDWPNKNETLYCFLPFLLFDLPNLFRKYQPPKMGSKRFETSSTKCYQQGRPIMHKLRMKSYFSSMIYIRFSKLAFVSFLHFRK